MTLTRLEVNDAERSLLRREYLFVLFQCFWSSFALFFCFRGFLGNFGSTVLFVFVLLMLLQGSEGSRWDGDGPRRDDLEFGLASFGTYSLLRLK